MRPAVSKIIPGNWGKVESGWLVQPLQRPGRKARRAEAGFTGSPGGVRALPEREMGTERQGAMRNCAKPSQVTQAGFEPV